MNFYTEAKLNNGISSSLSKKGINTTTDSIDELNGKNAIIDLSNIQYKEDTAYMSTLVNTCQKVEGYAKKIIYIPVSKWYRVEAGELDRTKTPLGSICRYIKQAPVEFKNKFDGFIFIFHNENKEAFPLYPSEYLSSEYPTFINLLNSLIKSKSVKLAFGDDTDRKSPVKDLTDKRKEKAQNLENKKQNLVNLIYSATENAESEEDAWAMINNDEYLKDLLAELEEEDDGRPNFSAARTSRMASLNDEFMKKEVHGKHIEEIIASNTSAREELPSSHLKVASINEEWNDMKFVNFQKSYHMNADIFAMLSALSVKSYPVSVIDIKVQNTSDNQDYIDTYTVELEDGYGKRTTLIFDIPKFKNSRFMRLRGNEKVISGQLFLLPCQKTDEDTVQCVSNYNKIFIYRHGLQGRSYPSSDRIIKTLRKLEDPSIKVITGDNRAICSKYELPTDYIDLASNLTRIETKDKVYYFNQDDYYTQFNADRSKGIPYSINKYDGSVNYYTSKNGTNMLITAIIAHELCTYSEQFDLLYKKTKAAQRLNYSQASIMSNRIPLVVVMGYSLGFDNLMKMCAPDYRYEDVKYKHDPNIEGVIRFKDRVAVYPLTYSTSMLLNGLSECETEIYNSSENNKRSMWLDFLDEFGGRILADGLDNFVDLFLDPITIEVCQHCKIPSTYFEMLLYANNLLADNCYNRHTDITGNRYRTNEIIAGYFYKALSKSYTDYKAAIKRGRKVGMTMKRSAVIDLVMQDPMLSDLSIMNPLLEIEAANSASFKGLSGMNSDRSYGLDKRTYDDTMVNKLALSTGFASNVGINRQTTIDMDIEGNRGYIKDSNDNTQDMSITKSFSMSEAVTPFGTTRDDPFRSAMTFIQTSKHSMPTKKSMPLLVTNGADEAMAYISSDTFAYKAKADGKVIELDLDHMIIEYDHPVISVDSLDNDTYTKEYISLEDQIMKNSDGGFYVTIKLDTDLDVGSIFHEGDIIAYHRASYSNKNGETDHLAYNLGVLAKVAILNTDEGFEDSTSVSSWLSDAMATDVVVEKDKDLSKNTNVYVMAKVGQVVQEGDPLLVFQNAYDEKDANMLLKNITDEDFVSDLGRVKLKSKYTGVVQDIRIYRTCNIEEMSESLQKIVKEYEAAILAKKAMYEKHGIPGASLLPPTYKMLPTGIMKNVSDGVKIVFYIKYNDKLSVGDKIVAQSANKGVVKNIFPEDLTPFSEFRPNEQIHALFAARSFNARMVTSVWSSGAINKCMIELDRAVKDIMGIEWPGLEDME